MNWIRENKFIAVFGGIIGVLAIALIALMLMASGQYATVTDEYTAQANQLHQLQSMSPYPEQANLDRVMAQKSAYTTSIRELQAKLAKMQYADEAVEPAQFQDLLKSAVAAAQEKAKTNGVKLPDNFYLGFTEYLSSPPLREAAGPLAKELKAIQFVVNTLLDAKVKSIDTIYRAGLPVEKRVVETKSTDLPEQAQPEASLMTREPFTVTFLSDQGRFRQALNIISASSEQFFVIRNLKVANEQPKGPSRTPDANATSAAMSASNGGQLPPQGEQSGSAPGATDGTTAANSSLTPVVGREKVSVTLALDVVNFAEPAAVTAAK